MTICPACKRNVSRLYPATGSLEVLEELSWEHDPNCDAVMRAIADEDGPWNANSRAYIAAHPTEAK